MRDRPEISIVIPMLNEEANVSVLMQRLFAVLEKLPESSEVICIDDGSTDRTLGLLKEEQGKRAGLVAVSLIRNFGQHAAVIAGFEMSRGDLVITMDADLQNPPEAIPLLVEKFREGHDLVGTFRNNRRDPLFRRLASRFVNIFMRKVSGISLRDFGCMLRGYSGQIAKAIAGHQEYKTFIPALGALYARNPVEIPIAHAPRENGKSKYGIGKLLELMLDLSIGFSLWPLRFLLFTGFLMAFLGIFFGSLLLALRLYYGSVWAGNGVFTLFAVLFVFIGSQFFAIGFVGEYVGRIYQEVRNRPFSTVREVSLPREYHRLEKILPQDNYVAK